MKNATTLLLLFFCHFTFSQGKLSKLKQDLYAYQYTGDYKNAYKTSENIVNLIEKKYPHQSFKLDQTLEIANQGELLRLMGKPHAQIAEKGLKAIAYAQITFGEHSWEAAQVKLYHLHTLTKYGFTKDLEQQFEALFAIANQQNWNESQLAKINQGYIHYLSATGFYTQALDLHEKTDQALQQSISKYALLAHPKKGTLKKKKLSNYSYHIAQRHYAEYLLSITNTYFMQGNYNKALEHAVVSKEWINKNLSSKDISYLKGEYLHGQIREKFELYIAAQKSYNNAQSKLGVVKDHLKLKDQESFIRDLNIAIGKLEIEESPSNHDGTNLIIKTKRKLISYYNGSEAEPQIRLMETLPYFYQHNYPKAIAQYERVHRDYFVLIQDSPLAIPFLEHGLTLYTTLDKKENIIPTLTELTKLYDKYYPENCPKRELFEARKNILQSRYSNDFEQSLNTLATIFSSINNDLHPQSTEYLNIVNNMADILKLNEDYPKAIETLKIGIESGKLYSQTVSPFYLEAHYNTEIASIYFDLGNLDAFAKHMNIADSIYTFLRLTSKKEHLYRSEYLVLEAKYNLLRGDLKKAQKSLESAGKFTYKELKKSKHDPRLYGNFEELILLDIQKGNYSRAEEQLLTSLKNKEATYGSTNRRLISTLSLLSELYLVTGDFTKANKIINQNLEIATQSFGTNSLTISQILSTKGKLLNTLGDYDGAIQHFNDALKIHPLFYSDQHIVTAQVLSPKGLSMMYSENHNTQQTLQTLQQASEMTEQALKTKNSPAFAESLENLALYYIRHNQLDQAQKLLSTASSIWEQLPGVPKINTHTATILLLEGDILKSKGKYDEAKAAYEKGKQYYLSIFDNQHPDYIYALSKLSKIYFIQNDEKNVRASVEEIAAHHIQFIQQYFPSLSEKDKTKYWQIINTDFEFYNNVAFKYNDKKYIENAYNYSLITKSLLLNSSLKTRQNILNSKDSSLIERFKTYIDKKEELASVLSSSTETLKENGINKEQLIKEINQLEITLSEQSTLFSKSKKEQITWNQIQKTLLPDEYAIEMLRYRKFDTDFTDEIIYSAFVLSAETKKTPHVIHFQNGKDLESKHINYYKNSTRFKTQDEESYPYFWKPIHDYVGNNNTIYLSADGVFNQINLEALRVDEKQYVIDLHNLVLVNNTKSVLNIKNKENKTQQTNRLACLVGNPNFYHANDYHTQEQEAGELQAIRQLPGTEQEITVSNNILKEKQWKTDLFLFNNATEDTVKKINNPTLLHLASHGFFIDNVKNDNGPANILENPLLRAGILLANAGDIIENNEVHEYNSQSGILTAYEVMNMNLDKTELVILSACETAVGKVHHGEGVYGLQRAFLMAGAKNIIMSLFKVDDTVTKELIISFYKHWNATNNKHIAFLQAKKEIREKYPQPIYWGAFVMIGN